MDELRRHQLVMLQMLQEVDRICRRHGIRYMLFAGTLLGAVRHQGFIPWDDDLDIVMTRPEYERFLSAAPADLNAGYYLQAEFTGHWPMFFSKLRKNGTACIERYIPKDEETHLGVYIDIFPMDNLYDSRWLRGLQYAASKLVIARALDARGYCTESTAKKLLMRVTRRLPADRLTAFVQNRKGSSSKKVHTFFGAASKYRKNVFDRAYFASETMVPFEGKSFPAPAEYDRVLSQIYGDYMTPTPEHQRGCKVHGELVDLEHSYEMYKGIQKTMTFDELSRSIR